MSTQSQLLESQGSVHRISGHLSHLLVHPDRFWIVLDGQGELITTDVVDSLSSGRRRPLGAVQAGDFLFPISTPSGQNKHSCMLISQEFLKVLEVPLEKLSEAASSLDRMCC